MVKKSKENVEIIAQKIFLELGHLNVHDLFKKKTFEINLPLMKLIKHRCYFVFFSFIPFTIVGNFINFIYLLNSKSNYKLPFRQTFTKILKDIYDQ